MESLALRGQFWGSRAGCWDQGKGQATRGCWACVPALPKPRSTEAGAKEREGEGQPEKGVVCIGRAGASPTDPVTFPEPTNHSAPRIPSPYRESLGC